MARKDHDPSDGGRCDICGTTLGDDAVIQEFPDGSLVSLCAGCASESAPPEEPEPEEALEGNDVTEEWTKPHDDSPTAPAPSLFEAEDFEFQDVAPAEQPAKPQPVDRELSADGAARAEAELAAWASASSGEPERSDTDEGYDEDYDQQEAEEAALQLVAAIAEANMVDDEQSRADTEADMGEVEPEPEVEVEPQEATPQTEAETKTEADSEPEGESEPEPTPLVKVETEVEPSSASGQGEGTVAPQVGDRTKEELLVPMADLITLQNEMQSALAKLSSTLEHFVADMDIDPKSASATNDLVRQLEDDLESTRERLGLNAALIPDAAAAMAAATATTDRDLVSEQATGKTPSAAVVSPPPLPTPPPLPKPATSAPGAVPPPSSRGGSQGTIAPPPLPVVPKSAAAPTAAAAAGATVAAGATLTPPPLGKKPTSATPTPPPMPSPEPHDPAAPAQPKQAERQPPAVTPPPQDASDATAVDDSAMLTADVTAPIATPTAPPASEAASQTASVGPVAGATAAVQKLLRGGKGQNQPEPETETAPEPEPQPVETPGLTFKINEVQVAQRYFNESEFVKKLGEICKGIGKPRANVSRTSAGAPEAAITVFWDIVWYQYVVDLRKNLPADTPRVTMAQEGMDTQELEPRFTEKNATINDDGRLDASELEVRLLSDPEALIANLEVSTPEDRLAEDATEEIWDQRSAPEFRWD